jgi:hypothetical protein
MLHAFNTVLPVHAIRVNMKNWVTIRMTRVTFIITKVSVKVCKKPEIENIT